MKRRLDAIRAGKGKTLSTQPVSTKHRRSFRGYDRHLEKRGSREEKANVAPESDKENLSAQNVGFQDPALRKRKNSRNSIARTTSSASVDIEEEDVLVKLPSKAGPGALSDGPILPGMWLSGHICEISRCICIHKAFVTLPCSF